MTTIKKIPLTVVALVLGIGGALATQHATHPFSQEWFKYDGSGDPGNSSNYSASVINGTDPNCPTQPTTVCAVFATPDATNSDIPDQSELDAIEANSNNFTQQASNLEYNRPAH